MSAHSALAYGLSPLMKPITEDLGWTRSAYAGATNARILLLTLLAPVAGLLVDRFGARLVLSVGALAMALGALGMTGMHGLGQLYALSLLIGPGQAGVGSVAGSALVLRLFRRRHGIAIGILNGGDNLITGMVHVASAHLLVASGWRGAVAALGAGYLLLALLVILALDAGMGRSDTRKAGNLREDLAGLPWRDRRLWLLLLAYVPIYAFITSIGLHFPAFQRDLGRSPEAASWIYGLTTIVGAGGSVLCGWLSERWSARRVLLLVTIGLLANSTVLWSPVGLGAYYAWAVGYGIVNAGAVALLALVLGEIFGAGRIGALMGLAISVCMAATMLGNWFSASVHDQLGTYAPVWRIYSALLLLALVPIVVLLRRDALQEHAQTAS